MATVTYVLEGDAFYNKRGIVVWAQVQGRAVQLQILPPKQCDAMWELHGEDGQVRLFANYQETVDYIHTL